MTELVAAVALVQLDRTRDYVKECIENANIYNQVLKDCEWLQPQGTYEHSVNTYHLYAAAFYGDQHGIQLDTFKKALSDNGCGLSFGYNNSQPAYLHPMFKDATAYDDTGCPIKCPFYKGNYQYKTGLCPNAEELMPRLMITGVFGAKENIQRNAENLRKAIEQAEGR
jgi:dTDP-4-amino-4,6-dideoxygalactose transaminase